MAGVAFQHVAKVYADGTRAVDDLTLEVCDGGFVVIVGPSGSGKEAGWLPSLDQMLVQVEAGDVEAEFGPQHAEEAEDVVGRLCECTGGEVDALAARLRERGHSVFVAGGDTEAVARRSGRGEPLQQALLIWPA